MIQYEVALSFAGEQRTYVEQVAITLQTRGISVYYDDFEKIILWGKDMTEELQSVYEHRSDHVVIFISKEWVEKAWPRHERRATLSRAVQEREEYVLPVRFDDTPVPGLPGSINYLQAKDYSSAELATHIAEKLGVKPFVGKASNVPPPRMTSLTGEAIFDYSNNNGRYVIGHGALEFETAWSKASDASIHVYNDPPSINGVAIAPRKLTAITEVVDATSLNFTSRTRTPDIGQIVVFRNTSGFYAAAKLGSEHQGRDSWRFS